MQDQEVSPEPGKGIDGILRALSEIDGYSARSVGQQSTWKEILSFRELGANRDSLPT